MLVINYNGNKPITDYFKFSVQGNNKADTIRFLISLNQGGLVFDETYHIYAKVQCVDDDYYDKVELDTVTFDDVSNLITADFVLKAQHTSHKQIEVSLSCEDLNNEVVWQTQIVKVTIANGIPADETIEDSYPTVLAQLQAQIDELKQQGGGGGLNEVEIKRVWLSYAEDQTIILKADTLGEEYDDGEDVLYFTNDSTRMFVNFETTPITETIKEEIKKGRFVIRLDYPIKGKQPINDRSNWCHRKPTHDYGVGARGYTHTFNLEGVMRAKKKNCLLNSLMFVNESDIKVNRYGEEYIHKQISLFDYINNMCLFDENGTPLTLAPITLEEIRDGSNGTYMFNDYLFTYCIGIPNLNESTSTPFAKYTGYAKTKLYLGNTPNRSSAGSSGVNFINSKKLNPAFNTYTPLKITNYSYLDSVTLFSPYYNNSRDRFDFSAGATRYFTRQKLGLPVVKKAKINCMVTKPRCAIVNDDYETSIYAFLKTYPQSDQQIKLNCKVLIDTDGDFGYGLLPVFRIMITPK